MALCIAELKKCVYVCVLQMIAIKKIDGWELLTESQVSILSSWCPIEVEKHYQRITQLSFDKGKKIAWLFNRKWNNEPGVATGDANNYYG